MKDHTIQGWTMDKERLKKGHMFTDEYFERQLQYIREIRLAERKFDQKGTDFYATEVGGGVGRILFPDELAVNRECNGSNNGKPY